MDVSEYPISNIPPRLKEFDHWVAWKIVPHNGRPTKLPVNSQNGQLASSTDPATWCSFEEAHLSFAKHAEWSGLGFVFGEDDPFAGVDLDDCLNEDGELIWGGDIVEGLKTYTEVSPSGRGLKIFLEGDKQAYANCRKDGFGPTGTGKVEVYDSKRFFTVTGNHLAGSPRTIERRQRDLVAMCHWLWPQRNGTQPRTARDKNTNDERRFADCLASMLAMDVPDHRDGSHRLFAACCRCVEHDLSDTEALECIGRYAVHVPFPQRWNDEAIMRRIRDAEKRCQRGLALRPGHASSSDLGAEESGPRCLPVGDLIERYPTLRTPVIDGLLRQGETMNVIAPPKLGKSWLVTDLAIAVGTGRNWLDAYPTHQGNVLLLDNELHAETSANRIPKVAEARGVSVSDIAHTVFVDNLRGRLLDFQTLRGYFDGIQPGFFKIIVMDAFYRFLPKDTDENSNGNLTDIYNLIDRYSADLGCSFVLVHHASKGNQSGKSVTDVGAGAGSQSRATDTHMVLRHHQEPGCVVVDAAVRSWPPIEPKVLRWEFPVWLSDEFLDPTELKLERPAKRSKTEDKPREKWTSEMFAKKFVTEKPQKMTLVRSEASKAGISQRLIKELQEEAEQQGLIYRWKSGANKPTSLASVPQPEEVAE